MKGKVSLLVLGVFLVALAVAFLVVPGENVEAAQQHICHIYEWPPPGENEYYDPAGNFHCWGDYETCCQTCAGTPGSDYFDRVIGHGDARLECWCVTI